MFIYFKGESKRKQGGMKEALKGFFISGVGGVSLGRVGFWLVFALALGTWGNDRDVPMGQLVTLNSFSV
jgi:hypothetical protein